MSADEDENMMTQTNEWKFPTPTGRVIRALKRKRFGDPSKDIVIVLCTQKGSEQPCGEHVRAGHAFMFHPVSYVELEIPQFFVLR